MEGEIYELIHKYKQMIRDEQKEDCISISFVIADLEALLPSGHVLA